MEPPTDLVSVEADGRYAGPPHQTSFTRDARSRGSYGSAIYRRTRRQARIGRRERRRERNTSGSIASPACYVDRRQGANLRILAFLHLTLVPIVVLIATRIGTTICRVQNPSRGVDMYETFDHVQPAIRSSPSPERPSYRVRKGWTKLQHGVERQGGTGLTPIVIYV